MSIYSRPTSVTTFVLLGLLNLILWGTYLDVFREAMGSFSQFVTSLGFILLGATMILSEFAKERSLVVPLGGWLLVVIGSVSVVLGARHYVLSRRS